MSTLIEATKQIEINVETDEAVTPNNIDLPTSGKLPNNAAESSDEDDPKESQPMNHNHNAVNEKQSQIQGSVSMAVNLSLAVNILLLISKISVFVMTFSLAVIATLVDSVLDLLSQSIIWLTERKVNKHTDIKSKYPVGKTRLEPIGMLTVSMLMVMLSVTVIRESIQTLMESQ